MIGATLSHYVVEGRLGEGGMGTVYLARDTLLGRPVAIKLVSPAADGDPNRAARFLREARAASSLNHPNIITIYEIGRADDREFIAMEFVEGQPLSRLIPPAGLPLAQVVEYASQIAVVRQDRGGCDGDRKSITRCGARASGRTGVRSVSGKNGRAPAPTPAVIAGGSCVEEGLVDWGAPAAPPTRHLVRLALIDEIERQRRRWLQAEHHAEEDDEDRVLVAERSIRAGGFSTSPTMPANHGRWRPGSACVRCGGNRSWAAQRTI